MLTWDRVMAAAVLVLPLALVDAARSETWCGLPVVEEASVGCRDAYDPRDYRYDAGTMEKDVARRTGGLYAPYTDRLARSLLETDLEHVVARSEAHASGGCLWPREKRRVFAGDTLNAVLAFPRVNRVEKRAKDAGEWMPARNAALFAWRVARVKSKWGLSVDARERDALAAALGGCP